MCSMIRLMILCLAMLLCNTAMAGNPPTAMVDSSRPVMSVVTLPVLVAMVPVKVGVKVATIPLRMTAAIVRTEVKMVSMLRPKNLLERVRR